MRVKMTFAVLAAAALALAVPASSTARTVHVDPGESIQAAINEAKPGTTIKLEEGTYRESVIISKDDISIVGEGRKKTEIAVPATVPEGQGCTQIVEEPGQPPRTIVSGICVFPEAEGDCELLPPSDPPAPTTARAVEDISVSKLAVTGFSDIGIIFFCAEDPEVTRVLAKGVEDSEHPAEYGIAAFGSEDVEFKRNLTVNGGEAGIYIGDSPHANATVWKNVSWDNGFGLFFRDADHGKAEKNKTFGNCIGILVLNTPGPFDARDWLLKHNNSTANNRACPAAEGPAVSGIGIAVLSAVDTHVIDNGVFGNDAGTNDTPFTGGIVLAALPLPPGAPSSPPATGTKVAFNTAHGNATDLVWLDGGAGSRFFANDCLTSQPDGLCEDPDDHGDEGEGDDGDNGHRGDDDNHRGDDHDKGDRDHRGDHKKHKKAKKHKSKKHKKHKSKKRHRDDD